MLEFDEFQEYVQMMLKDVLPENLKNATVSINNVTKSNGLRLHGISVQPAGSNIAPVIYLESFFNDYRNGKSMPVVLTEIAAIAADHVSPPAELADAARTFENFDSVKDRIIMAVVNTESNREYLADKPHTEVEDLSIIYKVVIGDNPEGMASVTIKNEHMECWNATTDELHDLAMKNTRKILPVTVKSMAETMAEMMGEDIPEEIAGAMMTSVPANQQMFVISNSSRLNGAASMFYEDVMADLAEEMGTDVYILPSSVHEVIAVSTYMGTPDMFADMVREINECEVSAEERLSDHVYRYDAQTRAITLADTTLAEIRANAPDFTADHEMTQAQGAPVRQRACCR